MPALDLAPGERARRILAIEVGSGRGEVELRLAGKAGPFADTVTRKLAIVPGGFPFQLAHGGLTVKGGAVAHRFDIPAGRVPGSLKTSLAVYPTPLANMTQALARLIQEPDGCFEQTSSTTYPLAMAQQYFTSHTGVDPKLVEAAREKLDAGYQRLVGFECSDKGYEWFGENPGHDALTAYGLLHFHDMAQVRPVDPVMIARSRDWLLRQRDGKGGFSRKRRALHTWVADRDASNGYILWALLESGQKGLERELASFKAAAAASSNSYVLALGANVLGAGRRPRGRPRADAAAGRQAGPRRGRGGRDDLHRGQRRRRAGHRDDGPGGAGLAERAGLRWIVENARSSTSPSPARTAATARPSRTVLALRAIVAYDKARARPKAPGQPARAGRRQAGGRRRSPSPQTPQGPSSSPTSPTASARANTRCSSR